MPIDLIKLFILAAIALVAIYIVVSLIRGTASRVRDANDAHRNSLSPIAVASPPPAPATPRRRVETDHDNRSADAIARAAGATAAVRPASTAKASAKRKTGKKVPKTVSKEPASGNQIDDLKKIKGIGPAIEAKLHDAGISTFAEIAAWKAADRKAFNEKLSFSGRIEREQWVKQAKALAKLQRE